MPDRHRRLDRLDAHLRAWDAGPRNDLADLPDDQMLGLYLRALTPLGDDQAPEDDELTPVLLDAVAPRFAGLTDEEITRTLTAAQVHPADRADLIRRIRAHRPIPGGTRP